MPLLCHHNHPIVSECNRSLAPAALPGLPLYPVARLYYTPVSASSQTLTVNRFLLLRTVHPFPLYVALVTLQLGTANSNSHFSIHLSVS